MRKVIVFSIVLFCLSIMFFSSCSKDSNIPEEENVTLYITDTKEKISVESLEEVKSILLNRYDHLSNLGESINRLDVFQNELSYSKSIDLNDPIVAKDYEKYLKEEYGKTNTIQDVESRNLEGILYDGQGSGFLTVTTIYPLNLVSSKRNRASSWLPIAGLNVLCEKTWWRGDKVVVVGFGGLNLIDLADLDFDNETDSYF